MIYQKVHQRKDGSYITPDAEQLVNQTRQLIDDRSTQMSPGGSSVASTNVPSISEQDAIFTQVAPKNKKGKVVGLGSIQNPAFNCRSSTSQFRGYVSQEDWEQSQSTIKALQEQVQSSQASVQALQAQQENYARQMEEMRQMIQSQVNLQQQSHGYRPMPPPMYVPSQGNAGPSTSRDDQNLDLSDHNIDLSLDTDFDFPEIHRQDP